jgi:hypothetical protein
MSGPVQTSWMNMFFTGVSALKVVPGVMAKDVGHVTIVADPPTWTFHKRANRDHPDFAYLTPLLGYGPQAMDQVRAQSQEVQWSEFVTALGQWLQTLEPVDCIDSSDPTDPSLQDCDAIIHIRRGSDTELL